MYNIVNNVRYNIGRYSSTSSIAHAHNAFQIIYIDNGEVNMQIDGESKVVSSPAVVIFNCFQKHRVISSTADYSRYIIELNNDAAKNLNNISLSAFISTKHKYGGVIPLEVESALDMERQINCISNEFYQNKTLKSVMLNGMVVQLLIKLYRLSGYDPCNDNAMVAEIREYIDNNLININSLNDISDRYNISIGYLIHSFKRHIGYSPMAYILYSRLNYSAVLLKSTDDSIRNISAAAGFADINNYNRQFKVMYNCTPNNYRKMYKL